MKPRRMFPVVLSALAVFAASDALATSSSQDPNDIPSQEPIIPVPRGDNGTPSQQPDQQPGQNPGQNPGNCSAVLRVDKEGPEGAFAGEIVKYRFFVFNAGVCNASGIDVVDTLPPGASIVQISPQETSSGGGQVTWEGLTIPAGGSLAFEVQVIFDAAAQGLVNTSCASQNLDPAVCDSVTTDIIGERR